MDVPPNEDCLATAHHYGDTDENGYHKPSVIPELLLFFKRLFMIALALLATLTQILLEAHLRRQSREQSTPTLILDQLFGGHQKCDPVSLVSPPTSISPRLRPYYTCESYIVVNLSLIGLYWTVVVNLFWRGRWRREYFPWNFAVCIAGTLLSSVFVRDPATQFLHVLPMLLDICLVVSAVHAGFVLYRGRGRGGRTEDREIQDFYVRSQKAEI